MHAGQIHTLAYVGWSAAAGVCYYSAMSWPVVTHSLLCIQALCVTDSLLPGLSGHSCMR